MYYFNHYLLLFQRLSHWKPAFIKMLATKGAVPSEMAASQFALAKQPDMSAVRLGKLTEILTISFVALILRVQIILLQPRMFGRELAYSLVLTDRHYCWRGWHSKTQKRKLWLNIFVFSS